MLIMKSSLIDAISGSCTPHPHQHLKH